MKLLKLKFFLMFSLFSMACIGQNCKYSKKMIKKAKKHLIEEKVVKATKPKAMFKKFSQAAGFNFVKSDKGYYLSLTLVREFGKRVDIMDDNPLVVQFKNDSIIILYPNRSTPGKFTLPVTTEINRPFYKVNPGQLELFGSQLIHYVKVYFTSDKVSEDKRGVDDLGIFFDYEILNEHYQSNCIEPANCILQ